MWVFAWIRICKVKFVLRNEGTSKVSCAPVWVQFIFQETTKDGFTAHANFSLKTLPILVRFFPNETFVTLKAKVAKPTLYATAKSLLIYQ